jgi:hypothetical protein
MLDKNHDIAVVRPMASQVGIPFARTSQPVREQDHRLRFVLRGVVDLDGDDPISFGIFGLEKKGGDFFGCDTADSRGKNHQG